MTRSSMIVVVGTDTGVGKTWTGCAMARALCRTGRTVVAIKPLETGCLDAPAEKEDGVVLARSTGQTEPQHALLRFHDPVAPPEAADREGRKIDFELLVHRIRGYGANADFVLVEGAGGLLSPLTWQCSAVDLARALEAKILLVAQDRLGTINHTLMALQLLEHASLEVVGVVLTAPEQQDSSTGSNAAAISRISGYQKILNVPRTQNLDLVNESIKEAVHWFQPA